jgi:YggT family protein
MIELLSLLIHLVCFGFYVRILFPGPDEHFFHPVLRFIREFTDPVILFLKKNRILNNNIHPVVPIVFLLYLKSLLLQSHARITLAPDGGAFVLSVFYFAAFLLKAYLLMFWLLVASMRFHFTDELFHLMAALYNKTLSRVLPGRRGVSVRNEPLPALGLTLAGFFLFFFLLTLALQLAAGGGSSISAAASARPALKIMLVSLVEMVRLLPFLLFIRIILSWFNPPMSRMLLLLFAATEPVLAPFRRLNLTVGMIDFSPILAFTVLYYVIQLLERLLLRFL